jgi:hypothetical protein
MSKGLPMKNFQQKEPTSHLSLVQVINNLVATINNQLFSAKAIKLQHPFSDSRQSNF